VGEAANGEEDGLAGGKRADRQHRHLAQRSHVAIAHAAESPAGTPAPAGELAALTRRDRLAVSRDRRETWCPEGLGAETPGENLE
jgi:hypothetical protein